MDIEIPVLAGYLNVPTQSGFPLNRISKKKPCQKYCLLFKSSRYGIERLEICESKEDKNPKIITLENCVKITQEPSPANLICIVKKTVTLTFSAINEESLKEWVNALQSVAFPNKNENTQSLSAIEEDNDLYCSSYGDGLFIVNLIPSEASIRCNIEPKCYMLHLTATELQLKSTNGLKYTISNWPYRFIRKYGYREGKFTFEAGRKCSTGEGVFILDHTNPQEVFRCMSSKMKCMKKLISGDMVNIDGCENHLNAAASMEPGSRSPLPPSFSAQHSSEVEVNCNQAFKGFPSTDPNCSQLVTQSPKIVPNKPPRKIVPNGDKSTAIDLANVPSNIEQYLNSQNTNKYTNFEPVTITTTVDPNKFVGSTVILKPQSPTTYRVINTLKGTLPEVFPGNDSLAAERDYESIENITDAWKTLGINHVKHTENMRRTPDCNDFHVVGWPRAKHANCKEKLKDSAHIATTPKIINIDIGESNKSVSSIVSTDFTYDRLDFLSPNNRTSSGYKTIVSVTSLPSQTSPIKPLQNEYELINVPDIDSCRKADDSHLGYGVLRKSKSSSAASHLSANIRSPNNETVYTSDESISDPQSNGLSNKPVRKPKKD